MLLFVHKKEKFSRLFTSSLETHQVTVIQDFKPLRFDLSYSPLGIVFHVCTLVQVCVMVTPS